MAVASETRIQSWILVKLKERYPESLFERQNVVAAVAVNKDGSKRVIKAGTKGQADLRGCYQGKFIELEIKRPGEQQTPDQRKRQIDVTRAGGIYAVVHNPNEAFAVVDAL